MARRTEAYVDTSALIAFADRSDTYHTLFRRLFAAPPNLITTILVVAEGHGWFLKRYDRTKALQFLNMMDAMRPLKVASLGSQDHRAATELLRKYSNQNLTIADAAGLHLMAKRQIQTCWSTDFHLELTRVPLVIYA